MSPLTLVPMFHQNQPNYNLNSSFFLFILFLKDGLFQTNPFYFFRFSLPQELSLYSSPKNHNSKKSIKKSRKKNISVNGCKKLKSLGAIPTPNFLKTYPFTVQKLKFS